LGQTRADFDCHFVIQKRALFLTFCETTHQKFGTPIYEIDIECPALIMKSSRNVDGKIISDAMTLQTKPDKLKD